MVPASPKLLVVRHDFWWPRSTGPPPWSHPDLRTSKPIEYCLHHSAWQTWPRHESDLETSVTITFSIVSLSSYLVSWTIQQQYNYNRCLPPPTPHQTKVGARTWLSSVTILTNKLLKHYKVIHPLQGIIYVTKLAVQLLLCKLKLV